VVAVWEGIRRKHGAPPDQAKPLMPPQLLDVLDACPTTRTWKTRPAEPDLAGLRDRALLLVGFFAALRRSELAALTIDQLAEHPHGLVLALPRSKTNQYGLDTELIVLPRAGHPARCPVTALHTWLGARRPHRRPGAAPTQQGQPSAAPSPAPRVDQRPRAGRRAPRRPGCHRLQRAFAACRVRHLATVVFGGPSSP
jgi:integrase